MNEALRKVADSLEELSKAIRELCTEPEIKPEEVRKVLVEMSKRGKTAEVKALLEKYGASKLSEVNPKDYAYLLKDASNA